MGNTNVQYLHILRCRRTCESRLVCSRILSTHIPKVYHHTCARGGGGKGIHPPQMIKSGEENVFCGGSQAYSTPWKSFLCLSTKNFWCTIEKPSRCTPLPQLWNQYVCIPLYNACVFYSFECRYIEKFNPVCTFVWHGGTVSVPNKQKRREGIPIMSAKLRCIKQSCTCCVTLRMDRPRECIAQFNGSVKHHWADCQAAWIRKGERRILAEKIKNVNPLTIYEDAIVKMNKDARDHSNLSGVGKHPQILANIKHEAKQSMRRDNNAIESVRKLKKEWIEKDKLEETENKKRHCTDLFM